MKNIFLTLSIIFNFLIYSQEIVPIENWNGQYESGKYYQDIHDVLNTYVGTWKYVNGDFEVTIETHKINMHPRGANVYEDALIGEIKIVSGSLIICNTIDIQTSSIYTFFYGNGIITDNSFLNCTDCIPNEKRVRVGFKDPLNSLIGYIVLKNTVFNGQEAIKIYVQYRSKNIIEGEPPLPARTIDFRWLTLIKQP